MEFRDVTITLCSGSWFHFRMVVGKNNLLFTVERENGIVHRYCCPLFTTIELMKEEGAFKIVNYPVHHCGFGLDSPIGFSKNACAFPSCIETKATVKIVRKCPMTLQQLKEAAARKNCGGIPHSCYSFVYHCVMNTWRNITVEVCATPINIIGGVCTEYNFEDVGVQRNGNYKCTNCPTAYNSTESFQYQECYQLVTTPDELTETAVTTSSLSFITKEENSIKDQHCDGDMSNNGCCNGYFWEIDNKKCKKCHPGYIGPNCTIQCPYPTYGELCQGYCNCRKENCDVSTGCRAPTTDS